MKKSAPTRKQILEWQEQTARMIAEHGRAVIAVMGDVEMEKDEQERSIAFAYTLGNCRHETPYPEVWSCYPSQPTMRFVLNHISDAIRDGQLGHLGSKPIEVKGFLGAKGEFPVRLRLMTPMEKVIAYERHTCQLPSATTPVCIAELPDPNGHFADDERCHPEVREVMSNAPFRVAAPESN